MQYWTTYFKANSSQRSFWPFYRGNAEDVWCKNSEVHIRLQSLMLSYIQQNLCIRSYTERIFLLPLTGSINWMTFLISKSRIYYSMEAGLMLSSSICPDNLMTFLEGFGCKILKQLSSLLCQNHSWCSHRTWLLFFFPPVTIPVTCRFQQLKKKRQSISVETKSIQSNISTIFRRGPKTRMSHISMSLPMTDVKGQ